MHDIDKETPPAYSLAFKVKSKHGYYGFMLYRGELAFEDNLVNPEHLNDTMFTEEEIFDFSQEIIHTIFKEL